MSRYRRVSTRVWGDENFRRLSPLPPSGQSLWLFLLSYPGFTAMPGLFRDTREGMAAALKWPLKEFDRCWLEISAGSHADGMRYGMPDAITPPLFSGPAGDTTPEGALNYGAASPMAVADWKAGVVWLPNAVAHNLPSSLNQVKSWAAFIDEIPECLIRAKAVLKTHDALLVMPKFAQVYVEYAFEALNAAADFVTIHGKPDDIPLAHRWANHMASRKASRMPTRRHPGRHTVSQAGSHTASPPHKPVPAPAPEPEPQPRSHTAREVYDFVTAAMQLHPTRPPDCTPDQVAELASQLSDTDRAAALADLTARAARHPKWLAPEDNGRFLPRLPKYLEQRLWMEVWENNGNPTPVTTKRKPVEEMTPDEVDAWVAKKVEQRREAGFA